MVELSAISNMLETMLNANNHGILFDIKADRNEYDEAKKTTDQFTVPGVLTALSGNYEPLQGIKVYNMPINLELFGYAQIEGEIPSVPYTVEHQKECVGSVVESLNGSTQTIGNNAMIFSGFTITVGNVMNDAGGGYTRIPILVQLQLTVVEKAVLFNNQKIKIDGQQVFFVDFNVALARQGEALTKSGTTTAKTLCNQMSRVFLGNAYLIDGAPFTNLQNEILQSNEINQVHALDYNNNSFSVVLLEATITGRMGAVMQISLSFAEVYDA